MDIKEEKNPNDIHIQKFKFSCDDIDPSIPKPLPQSLNFFMGLIGKPQSGKTTLLLNLVAKRKKNYNQKFDKVYVFSPSLLTMDTDPFENLDEEQKFTELTEENLQGVIDEIEDSGEKVLLVIDDCVNDISKDKSLERLLCKVAMNRRHITGSGGGISIMLTSQVYNKIPCALRKTLSQLVLMNGKQRRELDSLYEEHVLVPKPDFYKILNFCFKKKHDFMFLDLQQPYDKMFHRNFNHLDLNYPSEF
jgi:uncharacterized protein YaaR (DUF327 family)